jgi:hypothetical protein
MIEVVNNESNVGHLNGSKDNIHKLPVVKYDGYRPPSEFAFSMVSTYEERRQVLEWNTCRELFNKDILINFKYTDASGVDINMLRLLIKPPDYGNFKKNLFNARAALRLCEEHAGWSERSVISSVKHTHKIEAYLITGPGQWMASPQMLSLAIHIIRLICFNGPANVDDWDSFINWMENHYNYNHDVDHNHDIAYADDDDDDNYDDDDDAYEDEDEKHLEYVIKTNKLITKYLPDILTHSEALFEDNSLWAEDVIDDDEDVDESFYSNSGIVSFLEYLQINTRPKAKDYTRKYFTDSDNYFKKYVTKKADKFKKLIKQ